MISNKTPKLSVCATSYNHKDSIEVCVQSLLNQKVNFDYEIIIGDDCSTDGTAEILRSYQDKYPDIIRVIEHKKNIGGKFNLIATHSAARGEYIAHMDCDDYSLPGKLQAQVDILDNEPECNIVWHRMKILHNESGYIRDDMIALPLIWESRFTRGDVLRFGSVGCHSSKMYRAKYRNFQNIPEVSLDLIFDVFNIQDGYARYIGDFYGVYRSTSGTDSQLQGQKRKYLEILRYLQSVFPECKEQISENALMVVLSCIRNFDSNFFLALPIFLKSNSVTPIFKLVRDWRMRRCFRLR